ANMSKSASAAARKYQADGAAGGQPRHSCIVGGTPSPGMENPVGREATEPASRSSRPDRVGLVDQHEVGRAMKPPHVANLPVGVSIRLVIGIGYQHDVVRLSQAAAAPSRATAIAHVQNEIMLLLDCSECFGAQMAAHAVDKTDTSRQQGESPLDLVGKILLQGPVVNGNEGERFRRLR